jgi:hypothetical protein
MDLDPNPGDPNYMDSTDPDLDPQHWLTVRFCKFIASIKKRSVKKTTSTQLLVFHTGPENIAPKI